MLFLGIFSKKLKSKIVDRKRCGCSSWVEMDGATDNDAVFKIILNRFWWWSWQWHSKDLERLWIIKKRLRCLACINGQTFAAFGWWMHLNRRNYSVLGSYTLLQHPEAGDSSFACFQHFVSFNYRRKLILNRLINEIIIFYSCRFPTFFKKNQRWRCFKWCKLNDFSTRKFRRQADLSPLSSKTHFVRKQWTHNLSFLSDGTKKNATKHFAGNMCCLSL